MTQQEIKQNIASIDRELELWNQEIIKTKTKPEQACSMEYIQAEVDNLEYDRRKLVEQLNDNERRKYEQ